MRYRITADLNGNTDDKFEAEIEANSEDEAWVIAYRSQLPRGIYNGKVEELPTRAELIAENEQLREALKVISEIAVDAQGDWHSVQVPYMPYQLIPFKEIEDEAARALAQTRS